MVKEGVDLHQLTSVETFKLLKEKLSVKFVIVRAGRNNGYIDSNAGTNILNAKKAGIDDVDIYIYPLVKTGSLEKAAAERAKAYKQVLREQMNDGVRDITSQMRSMGFDDTANIIDGGAREARFYSTDKILENAVTNGYYNRSKIIELAEKLGIDNARFEFDEAHKMLEAIKNENLDLLTDEEELEIIFNDGRETVKQVLNSLYGVNYGMVWLDIEGTYHWYDDEDKNIEFIKGMIEGADYKNKRCGIYSSKYQWEPITGDTHIFSHLPLWYAHYDRKNDFDDFYNGYSFGGWEEPTIKQYSDDKTYKTEISKVKLDYNVKR